YSIADEVRVQEYLWSIVGSFLQQGQDFFPFAMSARTVMAFWWMFTVIVYSAYTANLTAFLTVHTENLPIRSLEDLLAQSSILPNVVLDSNLYTMFSQAPDGMYKQLAETMVAVPLGHCLDGVSAWACVLIGYCEPGHVYTDRTLESSQTRNFPKSKSLADHFSELTLHTISMRCGIFCLGSFGTLQVSEGHRACINDYSFLLPIANEKCKEYYIAKEHFNTATVAFMYPKDALYADKLHETGAMQRLFWTYMRSENVTSACASSSKGNAASTASSIGLNHVVGGLALTGCFYGLGLIILLVEVAWIRLGLSQPKDCVF
uniref:PBPe domain-containing protein n=1 Tax=Macrostomum lignano TaxID=282301 RepID=A0A1I8GZC1_9PLAT